ncbi:hypothetical protein PVK06_017215 [Gossypium arboreum]|uniref:Uncharacterized protein n=1 Tax=Gossypium arboreum TaxID=29729 RepID=A0ABR0Q2M1_GOSAR|nr:hypothetical protein PVK06_017215 [Gossypium arboreum]
MGKARVALEENRKKTEGTQKKMVEKGDSNHYRETPLDQLNPRELYKRYFHFSELLDLFHISRSKKIETASSILAPTGPTEDVPTLSYSHGH